MTGSPLYANLSDPGSGVTAEPQKPGSGQMGPESGTVSADLAALQSEREARTQLHLIEAARARFEAEACEREGHLYKPGTSRCVHCGHIDTSWIQMTTVKEGRGLFPALVAVVVVAVGLSWLVVYL